MRTSWILAVLSTIALTNCNANSEATRLADAQSCIDKSTPENVRSCLTDVTGIETARAYELRCAVEYLERGFGQPDRLVSVFAPLTSGDSTSSPILGAMSVLAFDNQDAARLTETYCNRSGRPGLVLIASFTSMATLIGGAGGALADLTNPNLTEAQKEQALKDALTAIASDSGSNAELGSTVKNLTGTYCSAGSTDPVCQDLIVTDSGGNELSDEEVGQALNCVLSYTSEELAGTSVSTDPRLNECRTLLAQ